MYIFANLNFWVLNELFFSEIWKNKDCSQENEFLNNLYSVTYNVMR